jgi:hypothetical protein
MQPGDRTERSEPIGKLIRRKEQTSDRAKVAGHPRQSHPPTPLCCAPVQSSTRTSTMRIPLSRRAAFCSRAQTDHRRRGQSTRHGGGVTGRSTPRPRVGRRRGTADVPADRDRSVDQVGDRMTNPKRTRHLYTHRGGKWATFYSNEALQTQLAFLNRHLRGGTAEPQPPVRLEVRESRDQSSRSVTRSAGRWSPPSGRHFISPAPACPPHPPPSTVPSASIPVLAERVSVGPCPRTPRSPGRWRYGCSSR